MIPAHFYFFTLKRGMPVCHDVWALQINLNDYFPALIPLREDGDFGEKTENRVIRFQAAKALVEDGIAGPVTQRTLALALIAPAQQSFKIPAGLMKGLVEGEANWIVGAVNWQVAGGVDCGWVQRRVLDQSFTDENFERAFDGQTQFSLVANELREKKDLFFGKVGAQTHKRAWELAVLNHNWQAAAQKYASGQFDAWRYTAADQDGVKRTYGVDEPAWWVIHIGVPGVSTARQWAEHYIDSKTMYVTNWTV